MTTADRLTLAGIGSAVVLAIVGGSCSTNARVDDLRADMNARFGDLNARFGDVNARFDEVNARFDEVNARIDEVNARIDVTNADRRNEHAEIRTGIRRIDDRLRAVERVVKPDQPAEQ